jgi:hypothetical protein
VDDAEHLPFPPNALLQLDLDLRLVGIWRELVEAEDLSLDLVAALLRAAYGQGYIDALREPEEAALLKAHGMRIPVRGER